MAICVCVTPAKVFQALNFSSYTHQEGEVEVDVMVGGHSVEDQVKAVGRGLHALLAAGHYEPVSSNLPRYSFLRLEDKEKRKREKSNNSFYFIDCK